MASGARQIQSVKAFSRRPEPREAFARRYSEKLGLDIQSVGTMAEAAGVRPGPQDDPLQPEVEPVGGSARVERGGW